MTFPLPTRNPFSFFQLSAVRTAVSIMVTVSVLPASATEGGQDATVRSITVMICTTVLAMDDVLDQTCASVLRVI